MKTPAAQIEAASSISIQSSRMPGLNSAILILVRRPSRWRRRKCFCSLYNLGRIKLYNVKATLKGGIKKEEVFVGNVESGATASIDAMLEGKKATNGPAKVTMTLGYEDEAGKPQPPKIFDYDR